MIFVRNNDFSAVRKIEGFLIFSNIFSQIHKFIDFW